MFREILLQAWDALQRHRLRSFLTMLGIVWGIVAVALLIAYGSSFRAVIWDGFQAFGRSAGGGRAGGAGGRGGGGARGEGQAGGERAGKRVVFEKEDLENVLAEATLVKAASLETVRWMPITYGDRLSDTALRGA